LGQAQLIEIKVRGQKNPVLKNPIDLWMRHPDRRTYTGFAFEPSDECPADKYNLWRGWPIEPKEGPCDLILNHIREIICSEDLVLYEWVVDWLAYMFQNIGGRRSDTAIALLGGQGTGKSFFINTIGKLLGRHFKQISQQLQLTGNFNLHLKDALLVYLDEAIWPGDKRAEGHLKSLITAPLVQIEGKHKDAFHITNHIRVMFSSNNRRVVPAGLDERRFCVLKVSDKRKNDRAYFKKIQDQLDNGGYAALLHFFLNKKITSNVWSIPQTDALFDQKLASMDSGQQYWYSCMSDEFLLDPGEPWPELVEKRRLYEHYLNYTQKRGYHHYLPDNQFFKVLKDLCPELKTVRLPANAKGKRPWAFQVPPLEVCRTAFEKSLGMPIRWDIGELAF